jgi:translocation and assembly module TamA
MKSVLKSFLFIFLISQFAHADDVEICNGIISKDGPINLNPNERGLVCGFTSGPEGWREIPITQSETHLKSILQNSGFLNPHFERSPQGLLVWRGDQTKIKSLQIFGVNEILDAKKKRNVIREALTPSKLNEIEHWANLTVSSQGYPCPILNLQARGWTGEVLLQSQPSSKQYFRPYKTVDLDGLNEDILKKYQPFEFGDLYDIRKTQIMSTRLLSDGLFQSAFFDTQCSNNQFDLELKVLVGPHKIFKFSFGASTEELPFSSLTFRNARIDNQASSFTAQLHGSPVKQSLTVDSEFYWLPGRHRTYIGPRFALSREIESVYQTDASRLGIDLGVKWDEWDSRFIGRIGPGLNTIKTTRGIGPTATYPTVEGSMTITSHDYEFSLADQYTGWTTSLFFRTQRKDVGSNVDATRLELNSKLLWTIGGYAPPLFVLGTRVQAITIQTSDEGALDQIPIDDRIFSGGDQNLRGFARKSINNSG